MHIFQQTRLLLLVFIVIYHYNSKLFGQSFALHSFTQSADYYSSNNFSGFHLEWQLDLGMSTISLNQSPEYFFTTGFIQPSIYRHQQNTKPSEFEPKILIRYNEYAQSVVLSSKESDLIIYGVHIFNFYGTFLFGIKTKIASSHLSMSIPISNQSTGIYFVQVYYLPENISSNQQFWSKTQKIFKQ